MRRNTILIIVLWQAVLAGELTEIQAPSVSETPPPQTMADGRTVAIRELNDRSAMQEEASSLGTDAKAGSARLTQSNGASLEGSIAYSIRGTSVTLEAGRVANNSTNHTTGTLQLELWATSSPYRGGGISGYQVAIYRFSQVLRPGQAYNNVSATVPLTAPPNGAYSMTMALTEYNGQFFIVDYATFDTRQTFGDLTSKLKLEGNVTFDRNGNRVTLHADSVANNGNGASGSIRLALWATTNVYSGGTIQGYETSFYQLSPLPGNRMYSNVTQQVAFQEPPAGTYFMTMTLEEYANNRWTVADWIRLPGQQTFGGGGTGLVLRGNTSFEAQDGRLHIRVDEVANTSSSSTTGTLRLELWAATQPYTGGKLTGYTMGIDRLPDVLAPNHSFRGIDDTVPFTAPPDGQYYASLLLTEWDGAQAQYVIRDFFTYPDPVNFGAHKPAEIINPADKSSITGSCVTITWTSAPGAVEYYLEVLNAQRQASYFSANVGKAAGRQICGFPQDGTTVSIRLWTNFGNNTWDQRASTFVSASANTRYKAEMISPQDRGTLPGSCVTFVWSRGSGVDEYYLQAGSSTVRSEYFDASLGTSTSTQVCGLPSNGGAVFVRLSSRFGKDWDTGAYTYTAARSSSGITATPNPMPCGVNTVALSWDVATSSDVQVRVNSASGPAMTGWSAARDTAMTGPWVVDGMQFLIVDRAGRTLAATTVKSACRVHTN